MGTRGKNFHCSTQLRPSFIHCLFHVLWETSLLVMYGLTRRSLTQYYDVLLSDQFITQTSTIDEYQACYITIIIVYLFTH